jgi:hypothetical protein
MARNTMSWPIDWESPARTEPTRKMTMAAWKIRLRPYRSPSLPYSGVETVAASR